MGKRVRGEVVRGGGVRQAKAEEHVHDHVTGLLGRDGKAHVITIAAAHDATHATAHAVWTEPNADANARMVRTALARSKVVRAICKPLQPLGANAFVPDVPSESFPSLPRRPVT